MQNSQQFLEQITQLVSNAQKNEHTEEYYMEQLNIKTKQIELMNQRVLNIQEVNTQLSQQIAMFRNNPISANIEYLELKHYNQQLIDKLNEYEQLFDKMNAELENRKFKLLQLTQQNLEIIKENQIVKTLLENQQYEEHETKQLEEQKYDAECQTDFCALPSKINVFATSSQQNLDTTTLINNELESAMIYPSHQGHENLQFEINDDIVQENDSMKKDEDELLITMKQQDSAPVSSVEHREFVRQNINQIIIGNEIVASKVVVSPAHVRFNQQQNLVINDSTLGDQTPRQAFSQMKKFQNESSQQDEISKNDCRSMPEQKAETPAMLKQDHMKQSESQEQFNVKNNILQQYATINLGAQKLADVPEVEIRNDSKQNSFKSADKLDEAEFAIDMPSKQEQMNFSDTNPQKYEIVTNAANNFNTDNLDW